MGEQLHYFRYQPGYVVPMHGWVEPDWTVVAIERDGSTVNPLVIAAEELVVTWDRESTKPFNDPEFKRFGIRGKRNGKPQSLTWEWKDGRYVSTVVPSPSKKP